MVSQKVSPSVQLALVFLFCGSVWIMISDPVSYAYANENFSFSQIQTYKGIIFMLITAAVIFFVSRRLFRKQRELQMQLTEERLRYKNELAREVVFAQEAERKKLGEELHDNINQLLGVIKLYIEHAQVNPAAKDEMLKRSAEYLLQVINEIRNLSKSLVSSTLTDIGLVESIKELIENIIEIKMIQIQLNDKNFCEKNLPENKKLILYRITQEQLNNVLKHSQAENVAIELKTTDNMIQMVIQDDGVGFDLDKIKSGVGLKNIQHRLELFNGKMNINSSPGKGCRLEVAFEV